MARQRARIGGNLGETHQRQRARAGDPMRAYDRLPPELRGWMANAALPWSTRSCLSIWKRELGAGGSARDALQRLDRAEAVALARGTGF